ncbi:putative DTW domain protein [Vibrio nigripulchritudo SFn27]|uniref:tRNA-uridine aminocarboxypropyltransferase n=1 Tax=Vibrio nigripulchritudo TaxID=28173 RepID=U4KAE3_9VIBR|nr:DTW domain-containing protein [Vibrio nigripulchritudo]CCN35286.1 putative DTW domain protein [Vibrio nigripulchritudo AM115]CCN42737.1 putative DTW domain protein [Vibrio nigripulchritudo FTn2]CCN64111.1 putative DTW domain protein [Vibrio nigripulchritudo POn4]CCN78913.1 putative DTW domain protein [Vibrio nigripulchritudo SO65]CCN80433.1 putative DTW domain protein [Vibrio nigripulchritudo BLFn1]
MPTDSDNSACSQCHLTWNCVCDALPSIHTGWRLVLLTHPNEFRRETNTGQWLEKSFQHCDIVEWNRVTPPESLCSLLGDPLVEVFLLFPGENSHPLTPSSFEDNGKHKVFIILDGTWQEAKKMYNRSPWLKALPHWNLKMSGESCYSLRRNQTSGHFCTLEVGIQLLSLSNNSKNEPLRRFFEHYLNVYQAEKSGHQWKGNQHDNNSK